MPGLVNARQRMGRNQVGSKPAWVPGTALDFVRKKTVLSCFVANALADSPVAKATLAHALPLGLPGVFVAIR